MGIPAYLRIAPLFAAIAISAAGCVTTTPETPGTNVAVSASHAAQITPGKWTGRFKSISQQTGTVHADIPTSYEFKRDGAGTYANELGSGDFTWKPKPDGTIAVDAGKGVRTYVLSQDKKGSYHLTARYDGVSPTGYPNIREVRIARVTSPVPPRSNRLDGAAFKKLVVGNTLKHEFVSSRTSRTYRFMYHFIDADRLLFSSVGDLPTIEESWSVSDADGWCRISGISGRKICYRDVQVSGATLRAKGTGDREHTMILMKGKHSY